MYFALIFYGGFFGAIALSMIGSELRAYPDDMSMYLLYSVPVGTLLGWLTGGIIALLIDEKFLPSSLLSFASASVVGAAHFTSLKDIEFRAHLSIETIGLFWCFLIFLLGLLSLYKSKRKQPVD